ncbi:MAG: hypothetical protein HQL37_07960 [Alphaproteobacteria bacterium]|nr:hypothetical protein [Alphaproteobacteria bacterium]
MSDATVVSRGGWNVRLMAALSYFGILCFVPLVVNKDDEFVAFHAKQGLILWVWSMLAVLSLYVPGIGRLLFEVSTFGVPAYSLIGLVAVMLNKAWKLPGVYELASKI